MVGHTAVTLSLRFISNDIQSALKKLIQASQFEQFENEIREIKNYKSSTSAVR